jgi:hypothetical protein
MRPLLVGEVKQANQQTLGSASIDGSAGGGGVTRESVNEVGDVVVLGVSGPWG